MSNDKRSWRKESVVSAAGTVSWRLTAGSWSLETGGKGKRLRLNLGPIDEETAERARQAMQAAEDAGLADRLIQLHRLDQDLAIRALLDDAPRLVDLPEGPVEYGALTVAEYFERYFQPWREEAVPLSWPGERTHWARLVQPQPHGLGDMRLREIESRAFTRWVRDLKVEGRGGNRRRPRAEGAPKQPATQPPSGNYQRLLRAALQAMLQYAYTEGHLETLVKLGEIRLKGSTKRAEAPTDPLSLEELLRLMEASAPKYRAMWAVGAGEGLRPSELCRIRWEDVHWERRTLEVRGRKTDAARDEVPLTPLAYNALQRWWVQCDRPEEGLAFPSDDGGSEYAARSSYKRALATAARHAKIERDVTPYLLRHSFATIAWSLGIEKDVARRVMRHADEAMLNKVYTRPRPADLVAKVAAFDAPETEPE